jgi:hypothetical protein
MVKLRRENHHLPESYQKGFADPSGKVWVKFRDEAEPQHRNPGSVGKSRNLYIPKGPDGTENDAVEKFFDKDVENSFALLSQRIKNEQNQFSEISAVELGTLCRFVASQAVRTLAHKQCIETQAGAAVDTNTFVRVMLRQMWTITKFWETNAPKVHFYTSLPLLGDYYITGDSPVLVILMNDNPVWVPTSAPTKGITDMTDVLMNPKYGFLITLSPYVCVLIHGQGGDGDAHLPPRPVEQRDVRFINNLVRGQSEIFTLARDKDSLISLPNSGVIEPANPTPRSQREIQR